MACQTHKTYTRRCSDCEYEQEIATLTARNAVLIDLVKASADLIEGLFNAEPTPLLGGHFGHDETEGEEDEEGECLTCIATALASAISAALSESLSPSSEKEGGS